MPSTGYTFSTTEFFSNQQDYRNIICCAGTCFEFVLKTECVPVANA